MTDSKSNGVNELSFEERKKALIAQGATRRRETDRSIDIVRTNLHVDRLAKSAVSHLTSAASDKVEHMLQSSGLTVGNVRNNITRYLPIAATAYSIIKRRNLGRPLLKGAGILAAVSGGAYLLWQRRQATQDAEDAMAAYPNYLDPDAP